jgi:chromosome segregation ATPase
MKRGLRPIEIMSAKEREEMYSRTHSEVRSHQFESQTIRLLKKEKKERAVSHELSDKMAMFKEKNKELEEKYIFMAARQQKIKEDIDNKKNSIQSYDNKVKHEQDKYKKEEETIKIKEEEVKKKKETKKSILNELKEVEDKIEKYMKYKILLDEVVGSTEDYEDIPQLMSRYSTLEDSVEKLLQKCRKIEEEQETEKQKHLNISKDLKESISINTSYLHNLEKEVETLNSNIASLQVQQEEQRKIEIEYKGMTGKIALSIKNIYSNVIKNKISEDDKDSNTLLLEMLEKIKNRYEDLKEISAAVMRETELKKAEAELNELEKNPAEG